MSDLIVTMTRADLDLALERAATKAAALPYYTQDNSPLGRERHCELLRAGTIKGWRKGRTWFARKEDVHAWIETPEVTVAQAESGDDLPAELASRLRAAGVRSA